MCLLEKGTHMREFRQKRNTFNCFRHDLITKQPLMHHKTSLKVYLDCKSWQESNGFVKIFFEQIRSEKVESI